MRPKVAASLVVLGIAVLPACSAASKTSASSDTTSTQSTGSGSTQPTSGSNPPTSGLGSTQTGSAPRPRVKVSPRAGHSRTHFVVTFTAPERTGTFSGSLRRYQVGAATTQGHSCVAAAGKSVGASRTGDRVSATLTPVQGHWCSGTYRGKIIETVTPRCAPLKACPALVGILHVVGKFKYRVS